MPVRRDSKGRFTSGSTHRAAKAVLGPAYGSTKGGHVTIAGRKATAGDIVRIRSMRSGQLRGARAAKAGQAMHVAFAKGLTRRPKKPRTVRARRR